MKLKAGVNLMGIRDRMFIAALMVEEVYEAHGYKLVITSGREGAHMQGSLHYKGLALDFRVWGISESKLREMCEEIREKLGPDYDVVPEFDKKTDQPHHLHVEYDPEPVG